MQVIVLSQWFNIWKNIKYTEWQLAPRYLLMYCTLFLPQPFAFFKKMCKPVHAVLGLQSIRFKHSILIHVWHMIDKGNKRSKNFLLNVYCRFWIYFIHKHISVDIKQFNVNNIVCVCVFEEGEGSKLKKKLYLMREFFTIYCKLHKFWYFK